MPLAALRPQLGLDPSRPEVSPASVMGLRNLAGQLSVVRTPTRLSPPCAMVTEPAHLHVLSEGPQGMFALHRLDPGIARSGVYERMPTLLLGQSPDLASGRSRHATAGSPET
jgi:hypothetical protein